MVVSSLALDAPDRMAYVDELTQRFDALPLVAEGESKVVRAVDGDNVVVRLKPTLFSYTANRADVVPGTERLRLDISTVLWQRLLDRGIPVTISAVGSDAYVSSRVVAPPIEVIVKAAHVGTPKHLYKGMAGCRTRDGEAMAADSRHAPYVRFDWRNPLPDKDECLPVALADRFIDTAAAERTALVAFDALSSFLADRAIELLDICFFVVEDGNALYGEISPDCMRAKHLDGDLDKDLWRKGRDPSVILEKWELFRRLVTA